MKDEKNIDLWINYIWSAGPTSAAHQVIKTSWLNGLGISTATTWSSSRQRSPPGTPRSKIPPFLYRVSVIPQRSLKGPEGWRGCLNSVQRLHPPERAAGASLSPIKRAWIRSWSIAQTGFPPPSFPLFFFFYSTLVPVVSVRCSVNNLRNDKNIRHQHLKLSWKHVWPRLHILTFFFLLSDKQFCPELYCYI